MRFHGDRDLGWTLKPGYNSAQLMWQIGCPTLAILFMPVADITNKYQCGSTANQAQAQDSLQGTQADQLEPEFMITPIWWQG